MIADRRVVVTGIGLVTPLGADAETSWSNLIAGRSGIRPIDRFDVADMPARIAGMLPEGEGGFRATDFLEAKDLKKNDLFIVYGIAAAAQALADAGYAPGTEEQKERAGVMIGSGIGGLQTIAETAVLLDQRGPRRVSPFFIPAALINLCSGQVSIRHGLKGP
ncbi:MAG: beta-ketoacyl-ACP synthase II, partial [Geminicoccaceae bacterium]|nr:beta-ketoacyl-ACP synthase II [Geminicoccaceae bacterium]